MGSEVFITAIIFYATYQIIKLISDHLLRRKIIKAGHIEQAGILEQHKMISDEADRYPSLKWGLVALMAGLGLILIEILRRYDHSWINYSDAVLPIGILLVFISLGFLIYFFIMNVKKRK